VLVDVDARADDRSRLLRGVTFHDSEDREQYPGILPPRGSDQVGTIDYHLSFNVCMTSGVGWFIESTTISCGSELGGIPQLTAHESIRGS